MLTSAGRMSRADSASAISHLMSVVAIATCVVGCTIESGRHEVGIYQAEASGGGTSGGTSAMGGSGELGGGGSGNGGDLGGGGDLGNGGDLGSDGGASPVVDQPSFFLTMYLRDFKKYSATDPLTNPAFDNGQCEKSVVSDALGSDRKPIYRAPQNAFPTFGQAYFDQWYRDVPGTNYLRVYPLPMSAQPGGIYEYDSRKSGVADVYQGVARHVFFPIDDGSPYATPFGNQGGAHNFGFTGELHATFTSGPGDRVDIRSDDDFYLFIDQKLVIDGGGTHVSIEPSLNIDDLALTNGQSYAFDAFYAERMGATAELMIRTNFVLTPSPG